MTAYMEWTNNHQALMVGIALFLMIFGMPLVDRALDWLL